MTREELIDELNNRIGFETDNERYSMSEYEKEFYRDILNVLEKEPKTGKWIEKDGFDGDTYYDCSECGESFCLIDGTPTDNLYNYCPNCGCRMVETQE